ncbi:hypothetical protein PVAND_000549 [Polypedilum vanderplanki]|uniref:PWWP domain-containing protein n=1 Tax=Polypedilum vanderplanki TaxID=319348 RepID=A0A9J6BKM0_POLVA|nr:hypothetical protein PVAND_000549 [Polypedilum vanderplanki]
MIVNSSNALSTNNLQPQIMQQQQQQQQFIQQQQNDTSSSSTNVVMRIIKDESGNEIIKSDAKLPPWKKNSMMQNQFVKTNNQQQQQTQVISTTSGIPIFQINGQMIAIDQQNQQFGNQSQQIQIIEHKTIDGEKTYIRRRPPSFKEDPTGYLNQQTALLHNSITTLHSPDGSTTSTSSTSPALQQQQQQIQESNNSEMLQQRTQKQFIQQIVKAGAMPSQVTTIGGQTVTHMSNGIVQIQNCDIKQQQQLKPIMIQEQIQQSPNKYIRTNPKGRPPKNAATIAKRLIAMSQESPVSSTSTASSVKITKSSTPDITSSSSHAEALTETMVQSSSFDGTEIVKIARNSSTQELIRTSMTQVIAGKQTNSTTTSSAIRKPTISMMKKPQQQTVLTQVKTTTNNNQLCGGNNGSGIITQNATNMTAGQQQVVMTSNGQQFIVMPSNIQQQPQNIMLNNNNAVVQIQNSGTNANQRLIQTTAGQSGNFIIQTSNGNVLATTAANPLTASNFIVNGQQLNQPLVLQNGQIIQNNGNLIASSKGNILVTGGTTSAAKTIIAGNNQLASPLLGQQTVLLQPHNSVMPQSTIIHPSSFIQAATSSNQQQQKIVVNPEKKKGRKRKIPLTDQVQTVTIQQQPQSTQTNTIQPGMIQMTATPQNYQLSSPTGNQQIIFQNPVSILGGGAQHQFIPSTAQPLMALSADGSSFVQIQNPSFNNIITTPQSMMIRTPTATATQQQQPIQKIITNNGQQFIVQGGQLNLMNQLQPFNPMGFVVQTAAATQQNQQIINPIVIQSPTQGQQIIAQPQILTHHHHQGPSQITTAQGTVLTQQAQFISQNDNKVQRKMVVQQKTQQQKFFPQMIKPPRTAMYTTAGKNSIPTIVQSIIEEPEEEEEENEEMIEQEEETEDVGEEIEHEELELSFDDDDKPDMIEELHHGTSQQILHSSAMLNDGQCGIMNIDDITIEMDEINDLNEYLNAIDEEDNKMSQMGLHSLSQHFANSPPDTTTHSPRSPNDNMNTMHIGSERSNGSSEGNNMVSSSEADSNVVSPECHQIIDSAQSPSQYNHHHNSGMQQQPPVFKLPMEPMRSNIKSPPSYNLMNTTNIFDANNRSPLMRPDSHESASSDNQQPQQQQQEQSQQNFQPSNDGYESSSSSSDEILKETNEQQPKEQQKSDFDLLKESPPVNTIKPPTDMIKSEDSPCRLSESPTLPIIESNNNSIGLIETNFKIGDLIWGAARGSDSLWPGKIVNGPEKEPTSSNCLWVKWFSGRQNTEMVQCNTLKSLSDGLEAHHASLARKETRKGRKLNSHLERAIQKAMAELDKQSEAENSLKSNNSSNKGSNEKKGVTSSHKSTKSRLIKIAPAPTDNNKK